MSKPYDATTKHLLETYPADWLAFMGLSGAQGELMDADLSTLTAAADRVFRVHGDAPSYVLRRRRRLKRPQSCGLRPTC